MSKWPKVKLGAVLRRVERFESRDELTEYPFAGTYSFARGLFVGERKMGSTFALPKIQRIRAGDFIYCKIMAWEGAFGIAPKAADNCVMSGAFVVYELNRDKIDGSFLDYFFKVPDHWQSIGSQSSGTNVRRQSLHPAQFERAEIPLPPLAEQRRVVARIEELAAQIHEARSLRNQAAEEADSVLQATVEDLCFRRGFQVVPLGDVLESAANGIYKPRHSWGSGLPCLRMYNIAGPRINRNNLQFLDVTNKEAEKYGCVPGDLIFNRVNSAELVGKTGIVPDGFPDCTFEAMNMRLRVKRELVSPQYAAQLLNAPSTKEFYRSKLKQQCGMASIHQGFVRAIPTPLPPLPEQRRIVAELDALQGEVDALKRLQTETAAELDALLPAILDRGFKGEL